MGHTPGPWTLECEDDDGELYQDGVRIDSPEGPVAFNVIDCSAPLIAAAPDLLAACHAVAHDLQAALDGDDFSGMPDAELFRAFLNVLLPAIAKAEGTPPPKGDT